MNSTAEMIADQANTYANLCHQQGPDATVSRDANLLARLAAASRLRRLVQAEETLLAGEVARLSEDPDTSLAKLQGAGTAGNLVAQVTGMSRTAAGTVVASGQAFRPRTDETGDPADPTCPLVAAAFSAGLLDPEVAAAMRRALAKCAPGLTPDALAELEAMLVDRAEEGYTADQLIEWLRKVPGYANPEGGQPGSAEPGATPVVRRKVLDNGLIRWILYLDPLTDGLLKTAVDANATKTRTGLITPDMPKPDPDTVDRRSWAQRSVDGIARVAKKALKVDDGQVGGTAVTLLVTMTEDALVSGLGVADLPDCGTQIPAGIARILAADAELIPVVLGGPSQPLDLGFSARFFSEAQRRAMVIRDGGCVGPGCTAPPSWCDGAHIRPAGYGPTNLDNGVLLCWRCQLMHDLEGWQLDRLDGRWWWTPPPSIDPPDGDDPADASHPSTSPPDTRWDGTNHDTVAPDPRCRSQPDSVPLTPCA